MLRRRRSNLRHFFQICNLRLDVGERAAKLVAVALIGGRVKVRLHAGSRKKQQVPAAALFGLCWSYLRATFSGFSLFRILDLILD